VLDTHWIPQVAARGRLIVTRQHDHPEQERDRCCPGEQGKDDGPQPAGRADEMGQHEVFMTQWLSIEAVISEPGLFIWRVSRTMMTQMPLAN
jgi:hypothetical protein